MVSPFTPSRWLAVIRKPTRAFLLRTSAAMLALSSVVAGGVAPAQAHPDDRHVLLISVDGLHASDLARWVAEHPNSNLAQLSHQGTTYLNASTSEPSDSFPGLLSMTTGGTPKTTGVYYDDSYARDMWAPGSNCVG